MCGRQTLESDGSGSWDFALTAHVDLSDAAGSLRVVALPVHWIPAPALPLADDDDSALAEARPPCIGAA